MRPLPCPKFAVGLIHFQFNIGNAIFGSNPAINPHVLSKAFQLEQNVVKSLQKKLWSGRIVSAQANSSSQRSDIWWKARHGEVLGKDSTCKDRSTKGMKDDGCPNIVETIEINKSQKGDQILKDVLTETETGRDLDIELVEHQKEANHSGVGEGVESFSVVPLQEKKANYGKSAEVITGVHGVMGSESETEFSDGIFRAILSEERIGGSSVEMAKGVVGLGQKKGMWKRWAREGGMRSCESYGEALLVKRLGILRSPKIEKLKFSGKLSLNSAAKSVQSPPSTAKAETDDGEEPNGSDNRAHRDLIEEPEAAGEHTEKTKGRVQASGEESVGVFRGTRRTCRVAER
ncbi:hypothetical protein LWI29_033691 [Acer saccharum]|uniref:Uncharacterized protein n=1 Tax=Acer saccharum TaxID=4024 RepID=A0AA39W4Q4_ACESA|nr:hypothetical protein LWI29_033691 [Acer saccharum]